MIEATLDARPWTGAALAALIAVVLYAPGVGHDYVYDDHLAIATNPAVQDGDAQLIATSNFWGPAEADRIATWRPAVTATFAVDAALARVVIPHRPAAWMHAVNVLLFGALCVALWALVLALGGSAGSAAAAALLLACHPAASEATAWLVARADLMLALFGLLYLRAHVRGRHGVALAWLVLALLSKESALVLPVIAALWSTIQTRRLGKSVTWRPWVGSVLVCAVWLAGRLLIFGSLAGPEATVVENPLIEADLAGRGLGALHVFALGGRLLFAPLWLSSDYGLDHFPQLEFGVWSAAGAMVVALMALFAWRWWRTWPEGAIWWGLLAGPALLYSHLLTPLPTGFAERLWLLPACGFCGALACVVARPAATQSESRALPAQTWLVLLLLVCLAGALRISWRLPDWQDDAAVYTAMVRDAPRSYRGLVNSAAILVERGDVEGARAHLGSATRIHAESPRAWLSLAQVEIAAGQRQGAAAALQKAEWAGGRSDKSLAVRCAWQVRWARPDQALATCERAAKAGNRPPDGERLMYLAMAYDKSGDAQAALDGMDKALVSFAGGRVPFVAHLNAGILFARQRRWQRAQDELERAVAMQPTNDAAKAALRTVYRVRRTK